jgi:hypothetical protein
MSSVVNFTASWKQVVSRAAPPQGIWSIRVIALCPLAGTWVKQFRLSQNVK